MNEGRIGAGHVFDHPDYGPPRYLYVWGSLFPRKWDGYTVQVRKTGNRRKSRPTNEDLGIGLDTWPPYLVDTYSWTRNQ